MVVLCPLGIWIASQSRLNVNSVFSYITSFSVVPSGVEESLILDSASSLAVRNNAGVIMPQMGRLRQAAARRANDRRDSLNCFIVSMWRNRSSFVLRHLTNTHRAYSVYRSSVSRRIRSLLREIGRASCRERGEISVV